MKQPATRVPAYPFRMTSEPEISWDLLAKFMRQHTHDVRNGLNSLDLEAAYLREIVTDDEARASAVRVREQVRVLADQLRSMSALFQIPQCYIAPLAASELMLIWREQYNAMPNRPVVEWVSEVGEEKVNVDAGMMATIFQELLLNAYSFRDGEPAVASVRSSGGSVTFEIREPKTKLLDLSQWGKRVFETTKRGGYGLGLWTVTRLCEAMGATLTHGNENGSLVTRITLPVSE